MTEAYKIGVTVAMTNLVSAELQKITNSLLSAEKHAKGLELGLGSLAKIGLGAGFVSAFALLGAGVKEAAKFQIEATKFASLGFGDVVNNQAQAFAKGMNTLGTSSTENMALVSDAMAVFKDLAHSEVAAPLMAQMKFANEAIYGAEGGGEHDKKFMDMLKVIEFRGGLKSDDEFKSQTDFVQKVIDGSRNRVDATQMLMALKTGGVSLAGLSNQAFYLGSEPLIQEFGGSRYGTANMSAYQNLVMMRTTQQALSEMMSLGLLDPSKVEMNKYTGKVKRATAGAFRGSEVLTGEGDLAFLEKVLLPAFAKKGITGDDAIIQELGRIFTNRTASGLFARVYQQRASLHNQVDANQNAMGISAITKAADGTLNGKLIELGAAWQTFEQQMGVLLPYVTQMTGFLVKVVKALQLDSTFSDTVGNFINRQWNEDKGLFGGWESLKRTIGYGGAVPPPATKQPITVNSTTVLDGKVIANSTSQILANAFAGPPSQGSAVNSGMAYIPVH